MPITFAIKKAITFLGTFFGINDAGDQLVLNDEGDTLEI